MAASPSDDIKRLPQSEEAEQAVLGGLMLESRHLDDIVEILSPEDFHIHTHRTIFRAISAITEESGSADAVTVSDHLSNNGELESSGGLAYLRTLVDNTPSVAHIKDYAKIVHERAILRRLVEATTNIAMRAYDPGGKTPREILDDAEHSVFEISEEHRKHDAGFVSLTQALGQALTHLEETAKSESHLTGVATGFVDLDSMTSGLQRGDLIIIAGRPSMGKTSFAMNIATHVAIKEHKSVAVFSMEMPMMQLTMRLLSSVSHLSLQKLRNPRSLSDDDYANSIGPATKLLNSSGQIFIDDDGMLSPLDVRSRVRRLKRENKIENLGLVVVDYLQLMSSGDAQRGENRATEIARMTRSLKILAKELNVPMVVLSQLNRAVAARTDKKPIMSDLRESGAIEQDADLILFLHRDDEIPDDGKMELLVAKHRNGPVGVLNLTFRGDIVRFENYTPMDVSDMH